MKSTVTIIVLCYLCLTALAQAPQSFSYQAIARDLSGNVLAEKPVSIKISILSGSASGTVMYSETHAGKITNGYGLVDLEIGKGTVVIGTFSSIPWNNGSFFVKIEMDPAGGTAYQELGTSQMLSVPYALHANTANTSNFENLTNRPTTLEGYGITDAVSQKSLDALEQKIDKMSWMLEDPANRSLIKDIDGTYYKAIMIGTQMWMTENLKTTKYNDRTPIPLVMDDAVWTALTSNAYCWYNNDPGNKDVYGALYNWYAVNTAKLCPTGWHVPSDAEWITLRDYLTNNGYGYEGSGDDIAKSMAATTNWISWEIPGLPGNDLASNNSSGFTGLPGGLRRYSGSFKDLGAGGYWWSSTEYSSAHAYYRHLYYINPNLRGFGDTKDYGFSVRCLRDN